MSAYLFASIEVLDGPAYEEYRKRVPAVIAAHGGRYLVRGGAAQRLEGEGALDRLVILEFPDMAHLKGFYESAEYRPLIAIRQRAAKSDLIAVQGI